MRIAINCADLDHSRIDGTRVYIKKCLDHFGSFDNYSVFTLYHKTKFNPELKPKIYSNYQDEVIPYPVWWVQTRFGFEINYTVPDVCWMPIQQVPFLANRRATKIVITIHDLAFKYFPQHFPLMDRIKLDFFTETAVKRADKIIAVSEATKQDILKFYPKTNPQKIKVIYHGVDKGDYCQKISSEKSAEILSKYGIKKDYLLYVGALQPRKNLETLVAAFEKLKKGGDKKTQLVLAGQPAWKSEKILEKIKNSKFKEDIILTGKVSFVDLPFIYQKALMFILPSLYEGFGIPILEAWASKIPVIVANNSSLKEIGEEGVLKFEALEDEELLEKINILLKRDIIRIELIEKGTKRLSKFSWERCAQETLDFIKK
jgi:glycosyltransferase involved in cell wall biosynthesis